MIPDSATPLDPQATAGVVDLEAAANPTPTPSWRFAPIGSRLVVRPIPEGERTVGTIVIPDTAKERPSMGEVVAVGVLVMRSLSCGDRVLYGKYSGHEVTIDEITYVVLELGEVLSRMLPGDQLDGAMEGDDDELL